MYSQRCLCAITCAEKSPLNDEMIIVGFITSTISMTSSSLYIILKEMLIVFKFFSGCVVRAKSIEIGAELLIDHMTNETTST